MKLYKTFARHEQVVLLPRYIGIHLFLIDRRHKHLKNTIDLLLFYGELFYGFLEVY